MENKGYSTEGGLAMKKWSHRFLKKFAQTGGKKHPKNQDRRQDLLERVFAWFVVFLLPEKTAIGVLDAFHINTLLR